MEDDKIKITRQDLMSLGFAVSIDENYVITPEKFDLSQDDLKPGITLNDGSGTHIIFYSYSEKHLTDDKIKPDHQLREESGGKFEEISFEYQLATENAMGVFEDAANIKFFDLDNLTYENKQYLNGRIEIPEQPDLVFGKAQFLNSKNGAYAMMPSDVNPLENDIQYTIFNSDHEANLSQEHMVTELEYIAVHELTHSFNYDHAGAIKNYPSDYDNGFNTVTSYAEPRIPVLGAVDIYNLQKDYGKPIGAEFEFELDISSLKKLNRADDIAKAGSIEDFVDNNSEIDPQEKDLINYAKEVFQLDNNLSDEEKKYLIEAAVEFSNEVSPTDYLQASKDEITKNYKPIIDANRNSENPTKDDRQR